MRLKYSFLFILSSLLFSSCTTTKETFWVSGLKTECSSETGNMECLNIYKGNDVNKAEWENFHSTIKGFKYNPGYLQKIKVEKEEVKSAKSDADKSSKKYTLVKVVDKKIDKRLLAEENWKLSKIGDNSIDKIDAIPNLNINLKEMQINGNGGCNDYGATLKTLGQKDIEIESLKSTLMACGNKNVEAEYFQTLEKTRKYDVDSSNLRLFNAEGQLLLAFQKNNTPLYPTQLNDIWNLEKIDGQLIENGDHFLRPRLEINLSKMMIMGDDGCNEFHGKILKLTENEIKFTPLAKKKKMCPNMELPMKFSAVMKRVRNYQLNKLHLYFSDEEENVLLQFLKGD